MKNIATSRLENDFTFIVGDLSYSCPWFVAAWRPPKVAQLRSLDPTLREFTIETKDPGNHFEEFLSLGRGCGVAITEANRSFLLAIAFELANEELFSTLCSRSGGGFSQSELAQFCHRGVRGEVLSM
jgi:hypothetical protein